jgi:hypothetical protein
MTNEYKLTINEKRVITDIDLDSYLPFIDYTETVKAESWCRQHAPTAKVWRSIHADSVYTYIKWFIEFETMEDLVLYQLSN